MAALSAQAEGPSDTIVSDPGPAPDQRAMVPIYHELMQITRERAAEAKEEQFLAKQEVMGLRAVSRRVLKDLKDMMPPQTVTTGAEAYCQATDDFGTAISQFPDLSDFCHHMFAAAGDPNNTRNRKGPKTFYKVCSTIYRDERMMIRH